MSESDVALQKVVGTKIDMMWADYKYRNRVDIIVNAILAEIRHGNAIESNKLSIFAGRGMPEEVSLPALSLAQNLAREYDDYVRQAVATAYEGSVLSSYNIGLWAVASIKVFTYTDNTQIQTGGVNIKFTSPFKSKKIYKLE